MAAAALGSILSVSPVRVTAFLPRRMTTCFSDGDSYRVAMNEMGCGGHALLSLISSRVVNVNGIESVHELACVSELFGSEDFFL